MELEDRITIQTPEGVTLEMTLAGLGSRIAASLVDGLIKGAVAIAVLLFGWFAGGLNTDSSALVSGFISIMAFLLVFVYDVVFETWNSGRTPGKTATGLRVIRASGAPVGFVASAIRNILRIVDLLPGVYFIGIVAVVATQHNQRIGDLAAGTLVVRDRSGVARLPELQVEAPIRSSTDPAWDVSGVNAREVAVIRQFLERRADLDEATRRRLAEQIAAPLRSKVFGPPAELDAEAFLRRLAAEKAIRS